MAATIGGDAGKVTFADDQLQFVGLDQVVTRVPRSLVGRGLVTVIITVDGKTANIVRVNSQ